jgi:signal transduction histidine kinase
MLNSPKSAPQPTVLSEPVRDVSAVRIALILAVVYGLSCSAYIVLSTKFAAQMSQSIPEMLDIETYKGVIFVLISSCFFFVFAWKLLTRLEVQNQNLQTLRALLVDVEQRTLTGLFAGSIAHDINNMLTVAQCQLSELADSATNLASKDLASQATAVTISLEEISKLSGRLSRIGQQQPRGEWTTGELSATITRAVTIGRQHLRVRRCEISLSIEPTPPSRHNALLVSRSVINLLINAGDATDGRGRVEIRLFREGESLVLEVHDDGTGVSPQHEHAIFEEHFTTKPDGTGLGLLIVAVCAREHGGKAQVTPSPLGGACFRMTFAARQSPLPD